MQKDLTSPPLPSPKIMMLSYSTAQANAIAHTHQTAGTMPIAFNIPLASGDSRKALIQDVANVFPPHCQSLGRNALYGSHHIQIELQKPLS